MRHLLAAVLALTFVSVTTAQYPKTLTLTVTRITRTQKDTPTCAGCTTVTKVEAHTATTNYELTCEATTVVETPSLSTYCVQFETGVYAVPMTAPNSVFFKPSSPAGNQIQAAYIITVEEMRTKQ